MKSYDVILQQIPKAITQFFMYYAVITVVYLLVWKVFKKRLQNWRIQLKQRVDAKQIKGELVNSIFTLLASTLLVGVIFYCQTAGYTKIYTDVASYPQWYAYTGFFVFLLVDDAWFYWVHRILHHPKLFPYIHKIHHKSIDVNPFTSLSFHWAESLLLTSWILPLSMVFPIYVPALAAVQVWGFLDNIKSHLGYEFFPSWWNKSVGKVLTSSTHHNMHHSKFKGNYGVHFRIWDRLMGTEFNNYEQEFDAIQRRKKGEFTSATH